MKKSIVLKTRIYSGTVSSCDNLADLIIGVTGSSVDAFANLRDLENSYPNFYEWYHKTVLPDIREGKNGRCMFFAVSDVFEKGFISQQLTGLVILKSNLKEKKICTIRVFFRYQGQGIGKALLEQSFDYLGTRKPLITISDVNKKAFKYIIGKYEWKITQILPNYYKQGVIEYVYNGKLLSEEEHTKLLEDNLQSEINKKLLKKNIKTRNVRK